eukprot:761342-Hanusia_phi.AAC.3
MFLHIVDEFSSETQPRPTLFIPITLPLPDITLPLPDSTHLQPKYPLVGRLACSPPSNPALPYPTPPHPTIAKEEYPLPVAGSSREGRGAGWERGHLSVL